MTVVVEMVVDRGLVGSELLQGLDVPEAGHGASRRRKGRWEFSARSLSQRPRS